MFIEFSRISLWASSSPVGEDYSVDYNDESKSTETKVSVKKHQKGFSQEDEEWFRLNMNKTKNETVYYPCDKKSDLYVLQQDFILHNRGYSLDVKTNDSR